MPETVRATIGSMNNGPTETYILSAGRTVQDLLDQAEIVLREDKKEGVLAQSTGEPVFLNDAVVNGETYMVAPNVDSA